jgi:UDP-glucose 4-epimerase
MRALVTGGAGFLGSTLVDRLLAEGHSVDVVDDLSTGSLANLADARAEPGYDLTFHHLDIRDAGLVDLFVRRKPDVVFHLAAQTDLRLSLAHPSFDAEVNVAGSVNVIEGARRASATKVVFASSDAIYGDVGAGELPVREGHSRRPCSAFGIGKSAVLEYLEAYRETHQLEFTALVFAHVFGPRQEPTGDRGVVPLWVHRLLDGRTATIFGDGEQTRDFVFVDDAVDACARAAERGSGLLINVGTGVRTTLNSLYATVAAVIGSAEPPVHAPPRDGDVRHSALDPGRAAIQLGWKPWTTLADGVAAVAEWLADRRST